MNDFQLFCLILIGTTIGLLACYYMYCTYYGPCPECAAEELPQQEAGALVPLNEDDSDDDLPEIGGDSDDDDW